MATRSTGTLFIPKPPFPSSSSSSSSSSLRVSIPLDDYKTSQGYNNKNNNFQPVVSSVSPGSAEFPKVGILLLNLGGPETLEDVEGFLYNLFADPDIIRLPKPIQALQPIIAWLISKRRAPQSKQAYASIGGGSPILKYSQQQAELLLQSLQERHGIADAACYIGMRYWHPFTEEALAQIKKDNVEALVIVPLYPQFSISTSGSSLRVLQEEFARNTAPPVHTVVPSWYDRPGYIHAVADLIMTELEQITDQQVDVQKKETPDLAGKHVLFSAHGVPQSYIQAGDPYQSQMQKCVASIGKVLQEKHGDDVQIHLSYQSRVGPVEWLRPYTDDVIPELGQKGVRNLVVVPISFVSEHIETLEEIDMEYRELAEEHGINNWRRAPALNTHPGFVADLADMVAEALNEPSMTVTEACIANSVGNLIMLEDVADDGGMYNTAGVQNVVGAELEAANNDDSATFLVAGSAILVALTVAVMEFATQHPVLMGR
eukprot:scaffold39028_cov191-Amphora_coffeaeformis.AAC.1